MIFMSPSFAPQFKRILGKWINVDSWNILLMDDVDSWNDNKR